MRTACGREQQAESQGAFQVVIGDAGSRQHLGELLVSRGGIGEKPLAERGQGDTPAGAVQELTAQLALELSQALADP
ncbi:MAG: hypothetical protein ACRD2C_14765 [Acidimicrobiales bacterium]